MTDNIELMKSLNEVNGIIQENHKKIKSMKAEIRKLEADNERLQKTSNSLYDKITKGYEGAKIGVRELNCLAIVEPNITLSYACTALNNMDTQNGIIDLNGNKYILNDKGIKKYDFS